MRVIGCLTKSGSIASNTTVPLLLVVGTVIGLVVVVVVLLVEEAVGLQQGKYRHVGIAKYYFVGKAPKGMSARKKSCNIV
jgi:hypothetical protein